MNNKTFFNITAWGYDFITHQGIWREHVEAALERCSSQPERILDLGCGPGISAFTMAEILPDAEVVGLDISDVMIRRARRHHQKRYRHLDNLEFLEGDATSTNFDSDTFDLVFGHSFLYLVPDPVAVLQEARRILAPGGELILTEPNCGGNLVTATARTGRSGLGKTLRAPLTTCRFVTSMVLWRLVSGSVGQLDAEQVRRWFQAVGFDGVQIDETLGGLGLLCRARRAR